MIPAERLDLWQREALVQHSLHHGTNDERGEAAARLLATITDLRDLARHLEGSHGERDPRPR